MQDIISKKSIGERLRALRLGKDLSQAEVSEILGLSRSHYSQVELGKQFPSYSVLSRVAEFYSKDYEWILHGSDTKSVIGNVKAVLDSERLDGTVSVYASAQPETNIIPLYGAESKAVLLRLTECLTYIDKRDDKSYIDSLPEFLLPSSQLASGLYRAFEVEGDSMEGVLHYQDIAVGCNISNFIKIALSNVYVIVLARSIIIRRITNYNPDTRMFACVPDNRRYRTDYISVDDIKELWEVKARVSFRLNQAIESMSQYFNDFESSLYDLKEEVAKIKTSSM